MEGIEPMIRSLTVLMCTVFALACEQASGSDDSAMPLQSAAPPASPPAPAQPQSMAPAGDDSSMRAAPIMDMPITAADAGTDVAGPSTAADAGLADAGVSGADMGGASGASGSGAAGQ
jgi:hypothetical protein